MSIIQSKEERIIKLKRGIQSESTPDHIREEMKIMLAELEAPEPDINNGTVSAPDVNFDDDFESPEDKAKRLAINAKNRERRAKKKAAAAIPPPPTPEPPPPPKELTPEESEARIAEYTKRRERKKSEASE